MYDFSQILLIASAQTVKIMIYIHMFTVAQAIAKRKEHSYVLTFNFLGLVPCNFLCIPQFLIVQQ